MLWSLSPAEENSQSHSERRGESILNEIRTVNISQTKRVDIEQTKDEIRRLSRTDNIEIYRWVDEEVAEDLLLDLESTEIDQNRKRVHLEVLQHEQ
jgi:hypothetical protein